MIKTVCPLCGSAENYTVLYESNFCLADIHPESFSARRLPDGVHYQVVRCKNDGLVRSNPVWAADTDTLYQKSRFNYAEHIDDLTVSYLRVLNEALSDLPRQAKILEVGCGNGFVLRALWDRGYQNVYGVEPSLDAVSRADERIKDRITVGVLAEGLFNEGSFDLIFFFQTLDHVKDPSGFLNICHQLLKPGGRILGLNHNVESLSARILGEKSPIVDIEHTFLFSPQTMDRLFRKFGFRATRIFSPRSLVSLRYLLWLMPFVPKEIKLKLLNSGHKVLNWILRRRLRLALGNVCLVARKGL